MTPNSWGKMLNIRILRNDLEFTRWKTRIVVGYIWQSRPQSCMSTCRPRTTPFTIPNTTHVHLKIHPRAERFFNMVCRNIFSTLSCASKSFDRTMHLIPVSSKTEGLTASITTEFVQKQSLNTRSGEDIDEILFQKLLLSLWISFCADHGYQVV